MKVVIVIPARYKSTRLPGKPLVDILGKPMLLRTYLQCIKAHPAKWVYVATDDVRIQEFCNEHQIQVVMTSENCLTGTDRVAEFASKIEADYYINVQGDEPVINPKDILKIIENLNTYKGEILNGYTSIQNKEDFESTSTPKVVFRKDKRLLYMSRSPIPGNKKMDFDLGFRQVCVYAFSKQALMGFKNNTDKTPFEQVEDIEILRFLEMGHEVRMIEMSDESIPVDNPEDVLKVEKYINEKGHILGL